MNISLNWFKSKRRQKLEKLEIEQVRLENELLENEMIKARNAEVTSEESEQAPKFYKSLKLVGNSLTIVMNDGDVVTKCEADAESFKAVRNARSENEILEIILSKEQLTEKIKAEAESVKVESLINSFDNLARTGDFINDENSITFKETNRSLPELLVAKFSEVVGKYNDIESDKKLRKKLKKDEEYQSLKRFFMWCCLNPRVEVANDLFGFLQKNSFRLTKQGFFVALRNVVSLPSEDGKNSDKIEFISNSYQKIKAVWKKKPAGYNIWQEPDGHYIMSKLGVELDDRILIGNLQKLYDDLPNMKENRFTDAHTRTFDIRVGKVVWMPMAKCNWGTMDCMAAGLHFTSDEIHYVGCGDTSVLVLINPMKVVGIGTLKGRCYEYLPIMTVPRDEATAILHDVDFDTLELDENYAIHELENLEGQAKDGFKAETTKHEFNIPSISTKEMRNVIKSLSKMKKAISERIISVIK